MREVCITALTGGGAVENRRIQIFVNCMNLNVGMTKIMNEAMVIKIILLHLVAGTIVCFIGMMTVGHTTIQKYLRGILSIVIISMIASLGYVIINV